MSYLMTIRQTQAQKDMIENLKAKYIMRKKVSGYDLAVTQKPSIFRKNTKQSTQFSNCVDSAKADLGLLHFYFNHLKPMYRLRILNSNEFDSFNGKILFAQGSFNLQTKEREHLRLSKLIRVLLMEDLPSQLTPPNLVCHLKLYNKNLCLQDRRIALRLFA